METCGCENCGKTHVEIQAAKGTSQEPYCRQCFHARRSHQGTNERVCTKCLATPFDPAGSPAKFIYDGM